MNMLNDLLSDAEVKHKSLKGLKWVGMAEVMVRATYFIGTIILAKLLGPAIFGILGVCLIFLKLVQVVGDLGLGTTLVQKKILSSGHLDTIFTICVLFSLLLNLALYYLAPFVQYFFNFQNLARPLQILSFLFIPQTLSMLLKCLFMRKLAFKRLTIIEVLSVLGNISTAIVMAYAGYGIGSLIAGMYVEHLLVTMLSFVSLRWFPRPALNRAAITDMYYFASQVIISRISYFGTNTIDKLLIGKFLGEHILGIYLVAYNLIDMPVQRISKNITKVTFATLSNFQNNLPEFKKIYISINYYLSLIIVPLFAGIFIIAPEFIRIFYGHHWEEMIRPLRILCAAGIFRSMMVVFSSTFLALNQPRREARISLMQCAILFILLILALNTGIIGVSAAVSLSYALGFTVALYYLLPPMNMNLRDYLSLLATSLTGSGIIVSLWASNLLLMRRIMGDLLFMSFTIALCGMCFTCYLLMRDRTIFVKLKIFLSYE